MNDTERTSEDLAAALVADLRVIAEMVTAEPELVHIWMSALKGATGFVGFRYEDKPATLARFARTALRHNATVTKDADDDYSRVTASWSVLTMSAFASREQVCERVQVGEETVTVTVPDPSVVVPTVEVKETRPVYEWRCSPLLAAAEGGVSS